MIIEEQILEEVISTIPKERETKLIIDPDKTEKLFAILLESYKNPRAAVIREYTSNAWDAQKEAGKNDVPVVIELDEDEGGEYIQFIDEGIGMSYEFFMTEFRKLLCSTKENSNDYIGAWGIGSKTALAYTNSFYVETVKDGEKNYFMLLRETSNTIIITHLVTEQVDISNGTKVKVYLKPEYREYQTFAKLAATELAYFDNVIFRFPQDTSTQQTYNYGKIIEGNTFKYRTSSQYSSELHLILGKVAYPIDWKEVDLKSFDYSIAVGIKFEIGELPINMTRENIIYDDKSKALIKERIAATIEEIKERYIAQHKPIEDVWQYVKTKKEDKGKLLVFNADEYTKYSLNLYSIRNQLPNISFGIAKRLKINIIDADESVLLPCLRVHSKIVNGITKRAFHSLQLLNTNDTIVILVEKEFNSKEFNKYIQNCLVVKQIKLGYTAMKQWWDAVGLNSGEQRTIDNAIDDGYELYRTRKKKIKIEGAQIGRAKIYLAYRAAIMKQLKARWTKVIDYDTYIIPQAWKEEQRRIRRENKTQITRAKGTISIKNIITDSRHDLDLATLNDFTGIIVYGFQADKERLVKGKSLLECSKALKTVRKESRGTKTKVTINGKIREFYPTYKKIEDDLSQKAIRIYQIAQNNEYPFKNNFKNAIHINLFLMSKNRILDKIYTCGIIKRKYFNIMQQYEDVKNVNIRIGNLLKELLDYYDKNITEDEIRRLVITNELWHEIESNAKLLNLGDKNVLSIGKEIDAYFNNAEITTLLEWNDSNLPIIVKTLKLQKKKVNYYHYDSKSEVQLYKEVIEMPWIGKETIYPKLTKFSNHY